MNKSAEVDMRRTNNPRRGLPFRWELVIWLWLAFFFNQADRQVFSTVLPQIQANLGITDIQAGLLATIFTAALAITVPFAGYLGDVFNRAKIVSFSLLGWSAATMLTGFGSSFTYLLVVRSLATGVGEAFYAPAANALIAEHHTNTRARALAVNQTSLYAGVIVSGLVAGVIADCYGWRSSFWVFGACGMVLTVFVSMRLRPVIGRHVISTRPPATQWAEAFIVLRRPTVLMLMLAWACMVFVNIGYMTWMPTYLHEQFGLSLGNAGFSSMFYHHLGAFAGVMAGGFLSDRMAAKSPHKRLVLQGLALLGGVPFVWLLGTQAGLVTLYVALGGFGLFRGIYDAGIYASLFEVIEPRLRATVLGLIICVVYLIGALAPTILGALKGGLGLSMGFSMLALAYLVGGVALQIGGKYFFANDHKAAVIQSSN
jgi:MFS family permease